MTTTTLQCPDTPLPPAQGLPWAVGVGRVGGRGRVQVCGQLSPG
ncbi:hypothetical protein OG321_00545 [Streptomyces sp. NBC_00424]|nr:hypothetical protein [Streptomyces sp. NBC_00424]